MDYLTPLNIGTPKDALINTTFATLGYIAGLNRVKVQSSLITTEDHLAPANYYGVTFLPSGGGKDRPVSIIDKNIINNIREDFKKKAHEEFKAKKELVLKKAEELYPGKDSSARKEYIKDNMPRFLNDRMSDATPEGMNDTRKAFQMTNWGGTFLKVSEFGDFILSDRADRKDLLSLLKDIWEFGDSEAKNIKADKEPVSISGVPHSALLQTSVEELTDGKGRQRFMAFSNTGLARRCFLVYPEQMPNSDEKLSVRERAVKEIEEQERALELTKQYREHFEHSYRATQRRSVYGAENVYAMDADADMYLREYRIICRDKSSSMTHEGETSGLRTEIENRWSKVLRLSGLIAMFAHPDDKKVYQQDVESAVSFAEQAGEQIARFYEATSQGDADKLFEFFVARQGETFTKMQLREAALTDRRTFSDWFDKAYPLCQELALDAGYHLVKEVKERGRQEYTLTRIEDTKDQILISVGDSNNKTETSFEPTKLDFSKMHEITGQDKAWSSAKFKDNHRSDDDAVGGVELVTLDVDDGMTVEEVKEVLRQHKLKALISTTKSHQVEKDGKPACDRFRVVIPLKYKWVGNKQEYSDFIKGVVAKLGIPSDPATKNISRLWFGNPKQQYWYTEGDSMNYFQYTPAFDEKPRQIVQYRDGSKGNAGMVRFYTENYQKYGGRNNTLYIASQFFKNDKGLPVSEVIMLLEQINTQFPEPLDEREIRSTIYKSNGWG
jgi:hypothetical protein